MDNTKYDIEKDDSFRAWYCLKMAIDNISAAEHQMKAVPKLEPLIDYVEKSRQVLRKIQMQLHQ